MTLRVDYWPSAVRGLEPDSCAWHPTDPPGPAPPDRWRVDGRRIPLERAPTSAHAVTSDEMIAREWDMPLGARRAPMHIDWRHTLLVRPGAFAVWVDQLTSTSFHRYDGAVTIAGTLVSHDRDIRRIVVRHGTGLVKLVLAADYDADLAETPAGVRVVMHLRGHNTRFLVAAFRAPAAADLAPCDLRVAHGPVLEVRTRDGSQWVLHSNSRRRPMWIGPCRTDARWAVLDQTGRIALADFTRLTDPDGRALVDESDTVEARTCRVGPVSPDQPRPG